MKQDKTKCKAMRCYKCNEIIYVPESALNVYFTDCEERAKSSGLSGYCANCGIAYCSKHSDWAAMMPGYMYTQKCPLCGR